MGTGSVVGGQTKDNIGYNQHDAFSARRDGILATIERLMQDHSQTFLQFCKHLKMSFINISLIITILSPNHETSTFIKGVLSLLNCLRITA